MSFTEWSNKKKQEEKNTLSASSYIGDSTKVGTSSKGSFTDWSNRRRIESASSLQEWADTSSSFIKDMQKMSTSWYDEKEYKSRFDNFSSLLAQADNWRKQYWGNQDAISYIDSVVSAITDSKNFLTSSRKYYAQWKTEDDYKSYLNQQKEYEDKRNLDLDAYSRETSELEQKVKNYSPDFDWTDATQRKQYDAGLKELEDEISRRKEYLADAKRIQKKDALFSVADPQSSQYDSGFGSKSGYVSTELDGTLRRMSSQYGMGYDDLTYEYINNQNGIRDEILQNARTSSAHETPFERNAYDLMTEDEVKLYNYYYATGGKASAEAFLDTIQADLNQRKATGIYKQLNGKTLSELAFGIGAGLDQFQSGMESAFRGIVGDESYVAPSAKQYASSMVREDLADNGWKLPSWLGGASLGQVGYDAITTTANMIPSMIVGLANPAIGSAALGVSAGGGAYQEALNEGFSVNQARGYGILSGASEVIMEKLLGGISAYGGNKLGKYFAQNMRNADNALKRIAKEIGGSMLSEFSEEYLQEVLTPVFRNITLGTDDEVKLISADALYAGFLGAITGGILESPNAIINSRNATVTENATVDKVSAVTDESSAVGDKMSATENAPTLETLSEKYGNHAADMRKTYMDGQDIEKYDRAFKTVYDMGKSGASAEDVQKTDAASYLNESQIKSAYDAGVAASVEPEAVQVKAYEDTSRTNPANSREANAGTEGKFTPKNSTAQRAASEFSEDGKTVLINTGEEVTVKEIASKKDGQFQLRLDDGRIVDSDNVSFGSHDLATVYDAMEQMDINPSAADILVKNYNPGGELSGAEYAQQVKNAYRFGQYSIPEIELSRSDMTNSISEHQRNQAYKLGKVFGETTAQKKEANIRQKQASAPSQKSSESVAKKASVGKTEAGGKVHFDRKGRTFSDVQETGLKTMEQLSRLLGVEFHVFESYEKDGKRVYKDENGVEKNAPNGWYEPETGRIYIDLNAGINADGTILFTVAHEMTHFIRQWSPVKFDMLAEAVFKMAYETKNINVSELVREQQAKALRNNRDISFDEAYEEVVADSMESILTSGRVLEFMAEVKQQDKSLWQKIKKWFKDLSDDIRKLVKAYEGYKPDSPEGRAIASMEGILPILEGFYEDALRDAAENYKGVIEVKSAESNNGNNDGKNPEIRYSDRDYSYEALISKPDMPVTQLTDSVPDNRADVIALAKKNAAKIGKFNTKDGCVSVRVKDIGADVLLTTAGLRHGLDRRFNVNAPVTLKIGEILQNSIRINEMNPSKETASESYALIGASATEDGQLYVVRSVVNRFRNEISSVDVLYAVNSKSDANKKRNRAGDNPQGSRHDGRFLTGSTISISELLDYVNEYFPDILPEDVLKHYGHEERPVGKLGESALYSDRDPLQEKAVKALQEENAKLREDVSNLKDMVKLQKKLTGGKMMKPSSVEAAARVLKKSADATGDTKELAKLLGDFYAYIANGEELTWGDVKEAAQPAADWLWNNRKHTIDEYSAEILKELRTRGISFSEGQKSEAAMTHDTFANYRKALFGSVKITNDGMPLDEAWHELSGLYPDVFSEDTNSSDMPRELVDIVDRLRSSDGTYIGYDEIMARQSIIRDVYDSYWNVSTLYTVADVKQKEITLLKIKHKNKMDEVRSDHLEEVQQLRMEKQNSVKSVRQRHKKSELRRKIRKTVSELNKLLIHGNKKKNIKEGMKDFAATALASAEILFSDNISNEDMLLNGIGTQVDAKENRLIEETLTLLQKRKDLYNLDAASQELEDVVLTGESDSYALRMEESKKLDRKIYENMRELKSVFERERKRMNKATVSSFLENLAEAYKELGSSDALYIRSATDERVYQYLMQLKDKIGGATVRDMTVEQLKSVSDAYTMVLTTILNANKAFTDGRSIQADAEQIVSEFKSRKIPDKKLGIAVKRLLDSVGWNYEKLHYALDRIDSPTLSKLFGNLADSENITMRDVQEAKAYQMEMVEKYHYNDWKINQKIDHVFVDNTGKEFRLTLGELMALYAYSRREGADRHIEYGGFSFGETALTDPNPSSTYKLTAAQLKKITGMLTKEQRYFVESMQKYLSDTMGDKGNEVSMKLYGIKLFSEEIYFPLHIAGEFKAQAQESQAKAAAGFQSMSNAGFTQARNKDSIAPIVLEDFMTVWADHVNEMSRYHGAVPALEDIRRVMNYSVYNDSANESMSVEAAMTNAFGKQAVRYFDNLYREANSGAITDKLDAPHKKMLSMFRKNAVAYSLSVIIQQPASIYRARMEIDRKYFGRHGFFTLTGAGIRILNREKWNESYAEMMKYAPGVSMAKELGGFDTSTGSSIRSYLIDTGKSFVQSMKNDTWKYKAKSVMDLVDNNPVANLPNVMDKVAWIEMWEACKRETVAKNPNMRPGSEAFLQKVGQRFTEVIRATQVYDSMFSKSPMLKTKNLFVQSAVSFMNEPNTVANMAEAAIRDISRGNGKRAWKTGAALVTSIVATELLKSLIYAIRDDDEDETLLEKYVSAVAGSLIDDVTVFNYIPFARDVWSSWQGYDVERADMAIVSDAVNAIRKLAKMSDKDTASMTEEELEAWDREVTDCQWAVVETLSPMFGIPLKNIRRDILAVFNAVKIIGLDKGRESTVLSIQHAVEDAIWKGSKSNGDRLYEALVSGDREYAKRLRDNYKNESAYHTAVRKGLRDNDSRIWEAAVAWNSNDMATYFRIAKEIKGEKRFIQDDIVLAIRAEANAMEEKKQSSSGKVNGYFTNEKFGAALGQNNISMADTIRNDLIDTAVANGKTRVEAEESVRSTARTQLKQLFANGTITGANAEKMLVKYGGMETEEAKAMTKAWEWMNQNPNFEVTVEQVEAYQRPLEGLNRSVADMGIGMDIYLNEKKVVDSFESDKDENGKTIAYSRVNKAFPYINRLNLTREQKTALAVACGWSYKTVMENKLW